jgi:RNA polymerase sigma factor (sigma-70 family)
VLGCQEQFDSFCKKVLRNYARNYEKHLCKVKSRECFSEEICNDFKLRRYFSVPPHEETYIFRVMNMDVEVKDFILGAALEKLDDDRRHIALLSYFFEMTDQEITEYLNLIRRTVSYRRSATLKQLKKFLEAYVDG